MQFLPDEEEQQWLIEALAGVIRVRGQERFLKMPIVTPTRDCFPDPWSFTPMGLELVTLRLMQYAGLSELRVKLGTYVESDRTAIRRPSVRAGSTAGMFLGIENGCCYFAFNEEAAPDDEYMAGVMSHEVTHAYRAHHGLRDSSIEDSAEELLTDVTSVYLGFGVLAANNSYRFRSSGSWNVQSWSWHKVGYLPPQAFAYLLALQVHSRRMGARERRAVFRHLEPNQAAFVREAYDSIADWEHMLFERLGMEDPGSRLNRVSPGEILKPLPAISPAGEQGRSEIPVYLKINQGKTISRVMRTRTDIGLGGGLILGFGVGVALSMVLGSVWLWMPILAIAMLAGWQWGRLQVYPTCSHPDCLAILREDASKCDRCGGRIEGETAPPRARR